MGRPPVPKWVVPLFRPIPAGAGLLSKVSRGIVTWAEIRGLV
jgi:hypothetical protein